MSSSALGDYLRARRAAIGPSEVGLTSVGLRRVPGLRREEVAWLAGTSADYYVRLEQGRERHPSVSVLEALAAVLRLDDDARLHLFRLAGLTPATRRSVAVERVDPQLLVLMETWSAQPALVLGRAYDVLAANALGRALFGFAEGARENLLHKVFLDPEARSFYADWDRAATNTVAGFRLLHGEAPDDPRVRAVLAEMLEASPEFGDLWERHDARGKSAEHKRFVHPEVGELAVHMQSFDVRSAPGQQLVVYHPEPGSPTSERLALLGSLVATATTAES